MGPREDDTADSDFLEELDDLIEEHGLTGSQHIDTLRQAILEDDEEDDDE